MKWYRIWALTQRYLIPFPRDFGQWGALFFYPLLDLLLFGFVGVWMHHKGSTNEVLLLLSGVTLWQIFVRMTFGISLSLLDEIRTCNIINIFAAPIQLSEWLTATILRGLVMATASIIINTIFVWLVFGQYILTAGIFLPYACIQLICSGGAFGLIGAGLLLRWGPRVQTILYILGFLTSPVSGALYPTYVLPSWLHTGAHFLPFIYVFDGLARYIRDGTWHIPDLIWATICNSILVFIAILFFVHAYTTARKQGLSQLAE